VEGELLSKSMVGVFAIRWKGSEPDEVGYAQRDTRKDTRNVEEVGFGHMGCGERIDFCSAGSSAEHFLAH
jgi:hypothetical protein